MKYAIFIFIAGLSLQACRQQDDKVAADAASQSAADAAADNAALAEDIISLTAAQVKLANLSYISAEDQAQGGGAIRVSAELAVHPEDIAVVSAAFDGVITELKARLNDPVRKGQVIAVVRKTDLLDLQQRYLEHKDQLVFIQAEYDRYRALRDADATATKNLQRAEAELRAAQTTAAALGAKLRQYQINPDQLDAGSLKTQLNLTAPADGVITAFYTGLGTAVQPGTPICQITDLNKLHADLWLFEKDLPRVRTGQRVTLNLPANPNATFTAVIYSIDKALDPEKRALRAHARLEGGVNQPGWVNGAFIEAQIQLGEQLAGLSLPAEAVVREGLQDYIFVKEKEMNGLLYFRKIAVRKRGETDGQAIIEPVTLPPNAHIVSQGAYYVSARVEAEEE
jgi:RND family efflux transporter MFP subunit